MSTNNTTSDLREFHAFVASQLAAQGETLTPEDALDMWRDQHPAAEDADAVRKAVRLALQDMEDGDTGIPLAEFDKKFRAKHGLS